METDVFMSDPDDRFVETPIDYSLKPSIENENEEEGNEHIVGESEDDQSETSEADGPPIDTLALVQQIRSTLAALNLPQRHLLSIVDCAEGTLCVTLRKAGVAWELLHPANRKAFRALSDWVKANSTVEPPVVEEPPIKPESKSKGRKKKAGSPPPRGQKLVERNEEQSNDNSGVKRKRGRPRKSGLPEKIEIPPPSRKSTPVWMPGLSRLSVKEFMKNAADDGIVEEMDAMADFDVKTLSENVKQVLLARKMTQETLAFQLGVVLPTLNRILNDANWLPWSSTNEFRRAVILKMNAWLKDIDFKSSISTSGSSYTSSDEFSKPSADSAAADLSMKDEDEDEYLIDTPTSSADDKKFLLLSPGASSSRQIETVDDIPQIATREPYSTDDIREGDLIWPCLVGFSSPCLDEVVVDEVVNVSNRKRDLIKDSRLTLLNGHRYGLVGPCCSGKSALLKLLSSKKRTFTSVSKDAQIIYCDMQDLPPGASDTRVIAFLRQVGAEDADLLMAPPPFWDIKSVNEFNEGWRGLPEARARRILDGLGFTREMQSSRLRDLNPRWRSRLPLARALFSEPTLLLLDEPTTCLDIDAVLFLENYLQRYRNTFIVVTNCPSLLDHVCTDVIRIENEKLCYFSGSYRSYSRLNSSNVNDC